MEQSLVDLTFTFQFFVGAADKSPTRSLKKAEPKCVEKV